LKIILTINNKCENKEMEIENLGELLRKYFPHGSVWTSDRDTEGQRNIHHQKRKNSDSEIAGHFKVIKKEN